MISTKVFRKIGRNMEPNSKMIKPNYFEMFAFGFAMASLLSCTIIYSAIMFAGLSILFALLSRGSQMAFTPRAKKSIVISVVGILLAIVIFVGSLLFLLEEYSSFEGILRAGSEMMGLDFEAEFGYLFE